MREDTVRTDAITQRPVDEGFGGISVGSTETDDSQNFSCRSPVGHRRRLNSSGPIQAHSWISSPFQSMYIFGTPEAQRSGARTAGRDDRVPLCSLEPGLDPGPCELCAGCGAGMPAGCPVLVGLRAAQRKLTISTGTSNFAWTSVLVCFVRTPYDGDWIKCVSVWQLPRLTWPPLMAENSCLSSRCTACSGPSPMICWAVGTTQVGCTFPLLQFPSCTSISKPSRDDK